MPTPSVVVTRRVPKVAIARLQEECDVRLWNSDEPIPRATLLEWIAGVDGLYCLLTEAVNSELLDAAGPSLRVVSTMSVGYDHIDVAACAARNVAVGNTPGVLTDTTADLAVTLLLATARRIPEAVEAVKKGEWTTWKPEWMAGRDLFGSTVGIVGLGRIGAAVARRLTGFGCRLLYSDARPMPEVAREFNAAYVDFDTLLAESDFVTLHCPLTPETHHLMNDAAFAKMKRDAILINTSRGPVVDQEALYRALTSGKIAAAGLDVTVPEPLPADHPLVKLTNCVILPHIASASVETRAKMALIAADNLLAGVQGRPLPCPVYPV
jgi:lactate dehydrogenase-like 2-hydroxyacid dehydrogenase